MISLLTVVGARPNFVKVGALQAAFDAQEHITSRVLHTGQHYDEKMSDVFFRQLGLPEPSVYLGIGSGTHAEQTGNVMIAFEQELERSRPDLVVVVGDVNSTLACTLVCAKVGVPVAHVEAGLRSGDRSMPEEINRVVTDAVADYLFVSEQSGVENLLREGVPSDRLFFVGNVMIDTLMRLREKAENVHPLKNLNLQERGYVLMTMHRPATVDDPDQLSTLVQLIRHITDSYPIVFPVHPRTSQRLKQHGFWSEFSSLRGLYITEPLGYLEFLNVMMHAGAVVTDSGGVQEETTFLRMPCLTLRDTTERPTTVDYGTNVLFPLDVADVTNAVCDAMNGRWKSGSIPPLWDGRAAERIANILSEINEFRSR